MEIKRLNTFETNSSSMHSLIIRKDPDYYYKDFYPEDDGYVHSQFGEFGWGIDTYADPRVKLSYALTMIVETENVTSMEEFYKTDGMQMVNELFREVIDGCKGVFVDSNMKTKSYVNYAGETREYVEHDGYIDHQSYENYKSLREFLDDWGIDLRRFIFDENVALHIDNDNH